jgi:hypothetical protein
VPPDERPQPPNAGDRPGYPAQPPPAAPPPAPPPPAPPAAAQPPRADAGGRDRFRTRVAILIAVTSMIGAVVAFRASITSSNASSLDQLATQELVQQEQIEARLQGQVAQDLRLLGRYQQHVKAARLLERDANKVRGRFPELAERLATQAEGESYLARTMLPLFEVPPTAPDGKGNVSYDCDVVLAQLQAGDPDLAVLDPEQTAADAEAEEQKTLYLVGIAALLVAALFFFTIAQLAKRSTRGIFGVAGALVLVTGVALFAVVELGV